MLQLPAGEDMIEAVYDNNEIMRGGQYPVGINNCWHSGMHIHDEVHKAVKPVLPGTIAACRVSCVMRPLARPRKITGEEYDVLGKAQQLYRKLESAEDVYELEKTEISDTEYDELEPELKGLYADVTGNKKYVPVTRFSNSFLLTEHTFMLHNDDKDPEKVSFFTLYMGFKDHKFH